MRSVAVDVVGMDFGRISLGVGKGVQISLKEEDQMNTERNWLKRATLVSFDEIEGRSRFRDLFSFSCRRFAAGLL